MTTTATPKYGLFDVSNEILYNIISHLDMGTTICSRSTNTFFRDIFPPPTLGLWIKVPVYDALVHLLWKDRIISPRMKSRGTRCVEWDTRGPSRAYCTFYHVRGHYPYCLNGGGGASCPRIARSGQAMTQLGGDEPVVHHNPEMPWRLEKLFKTH